jgi:hypothetical protein
MVPIVTRVISIKHGGVRNIIIAKMGIYDMADNGKNRARGEMSQIN